MKHQVLLFAKKANAAAESTARELATWLTEKGYDPLDLSQTKGPISRDQTKNVVLAVVIGGDGTVLTLVRRLEDKEKFPVMGVNLGSLGFITDISRSDALRSVEEALAGRFTEESRPLLQVEVCQGSTCRLSGMVLNDVVLTKDARTSMLKFEVSVSGEHLSFVRADGYIVATPTGSTAYGLSAGGPLLHPKVPGMVAVAMCSHALSARPIVLPPDAIVTLNLKEFKGSVYLVLDGQVNHEIHPNDSIRIHDSKHKLRLLRSPRETWFQAVRAKLAME